MSFFIHVDEKLNTDDDKAAQALSELERRSNLYIGEQELAMRERIQCV